MFRRTASRDTFVEHPPTPLQVLEVPGYRQKSVAGLLIYTARRGVTGIPSGLGNAWAHRLMVLSLAAVIALALFTIWALEYPFSGGARIPTEAFELVLERVETSRLSVL